ncbi:hypothetical protein [Clostridium thermobutyricum]|uniref:hypothetical protein n=1 Tax=Clostridium thermobutyricum TaxID=29372 RepID=UPI0018AA639D|nr:hypothetical protein [Clostridium thermobutyricum]
MRKFRVTVTRTDEFEISIDENRIDENLITDFEGCMFNLGKDKIRKLAEHICSNSVDNYNLFIEGIGYVKIDGVIRSDMGMTKGINVESKIIEDTEIESREIKA